MIGIPLFLIGALLFINGLANLGNDKALLAVLGAGMMMVANWLLERSRKARNLL